MDTESGGGNSLLNGKQSLKRWSSAACAVPSPGDRLGESVSSSDPPPGDRRVGKWQEVRVLKPINWLPGRWHREASGGFDQRMDPAQLLVLGAAGAAEFLAPVKLVLAKPSLQVVLGKELSVLHVPVSALWRRTRRFTFKSSSCGTMSRVRAAGKAPGVFSDGSKRAGRGGSQTSTVAFQQETCKKGEEKTHLSASFPALVENHHSTKVLLKFGRMSTKQRTTQRWHV